MNENNYDNIRQGPPTENHNNPPQITLHSQNAFYNHSRLILVLFRSVSIAYARFLPPFIRRFIEFIFLSKAFLSLFILIYIHTVLVKSPITCLDHLRDYRNKSESLVNTEYGINCLETLYGKYACSEHEIDEFYDLTKPKNLERWPRDGILRVEIFSDDVPINYSLRDSYANEFLYTDVYVERPAFYFDRDKKSLEDTLEDEHWFIKDFIYKDYNKPVCSASIINEAPGDGNASEELFFSEEIDPSIHKTLKKNFIDLQHNFFLRISEALNEAPNKLQFFSNRALFFNRYIMEYSLENGLLRLSPNMREKLNVSVKLVVLNPNRQFCFDENFLTSFILEYIIGYNDILIGSLKRLSELSNLKVSNRGFVRNVVENSHYRFVSMSYSRISYLAAIFLMFVFTFTVSILFRYSHHQVFLLINDMIRMLQANIPFYVPAAPFMTLILALIAVETMMSEFFGDSITAFYLIIIVSMADRFEAVFCHSPISKKYWPRFFFLYHFLFYAYNYRFNGQHSHLALLCSWLFTQHSMIYFFHHYDLPYLMNNIHVQVNTPTNTAQQASLTQQNNATTNHDSNRAANENGEEVPRSQS